MKILSNVLNSRVFNSFLLISWFIVFIRFCVGYDVNKFLIGCSLAATFLYTIRWTIDAFIKSK